MYDMKMLHIKSNFHAKIYHNFIYIITHMHENIRMMILTIKQLYALKFIYKMK